MPASSIRSGAILVMAAGLLSACATSPQVQQRFAYFVVPCDTPGAIRTGAPPAIMADGIDSATAPAFGDAPTAAPAGAPTQPACIIAATEPPTYASSRYYPFGSYGRSYSARPVFSSFGLGFYGGSHGRGGHRGGGHLAGGHHGGGHNGGGRH